MQYVTLGKTGLNVSSAGLGCGGHSRLGQAYGNSTAQSIAIIHAAMDMGVNFIDTATAYGTEPIVGEAIEGRRDEVIISTKRTIFQQGTSPTGNELLTGAEFITGVEDNLKLLGTDHIDILHLHGVFANQYDHCVQELVPALQQLQDQGKIRFLGVTERFIRDTNHTMLSRALEDDVWDVVMTGFNMINPSARHTVLPKTQEKNTGTIIMFAVRRALSDPEATAEIISELISAGLIDPSDLDTENPFSFLLAPNCASSVTEAAYRFCRHEPGAHVVLTGTGSLEHLKENLEVLQMPALPTEAQNKLRNIFGNVDSVSGN